MTTTRGDRSSFDRFVRAVEAAGLRTTAHRRDDVMVQCPVHEDRRPSLHATYKATDGMTVLKCFAACDNQSIVEALGLTLADLFDEPLPPRMTVSGSTSRKPRRKPVQKKPAPKAKVPVERKPTDEELYGPATGPEQRTAVYEYCDTDGAVVGRQVRFEVPRERGHSKRFQQHHPAAGCADTDHKVAEPGWHYGGWPQQGLFLLPEVRAAIADHRVVVVCEGEKDTLTARDALGVAATTNCGGAPNWNPTCAGQLTGAGEVWLVLHRDLAGYRRGLTIPATLTAAGVKARVRVWLPAAADGINDLTDHVDAGHGLDALVPATAADLVALMSGLGAKGAQQAAVWLADQITAAPDELQAAFGVELAETLQLVIEQAPDAVATDAIVDYLAQLLGTHTTADDTPGIRVVIKTPDAVYRRPVYKIHEGAIWRRDKAGTVGRHGDFTPDVWSVLLGCLAKVDRAEYADNGDEELADPDEVPLTATFVVRWSQFVDGVEKDLGVQRVPADKWAKGDWLAQSPAVAAGVEIPDTAIDRGRCAAAIRMTSAGLIGRTPVYTSIGWRRSEEGGWYYVHAGSGSGRGSAITSSGCQEVRTHFTGPAAHISLPQPATAQQWRDGIDELVYLWDLLPERIGAVMIGLAGRAALGWTGPSLTFTGDYAAGKTSMATLLGAFYDPSLPYDRARMSLSKQGSTTLSVRRLMNQLADCIALLDDANPDGGTVAAAKLMADHARAHHEQVERHRADRDGTGVRGGGKPRGTQVMTGEMSPGDAGLNSAESRIFPIHVSAGEVDTRTVLPDLHRRDRRERRSSVLAGLVQWMAGQVDELRDGLQTLTERESEESYTRAFDAAGMPDRVSRSLADYLVGWRFWIAAAQDAGAIDAERADLLWRRAFSGLLDAGASAMQYADTARYDGQMREYIASALSMGEAHLVGWRGADLSLDMALACGWKEDQRPMFVGKNQDGTPIIERVVAPMGRRIGWVDEANGRVYLDPEAVLRVCSQMARLAGTQWDTTRRVMGASMRASGRCIPEMERVGGRLIQRSERRLRNGAHKVSVWDISLHWLMGTEDDDDNGGHQVAPPAPITGPVGAAAALPMAVGAENIPLPAAVSGRAGASMSVVDGIPADQIPTSAPGVAAESHRYAGVHPFDVLEPTFDKRQPEQLDRCIDCGHPCSMIFGEIVLHPACVLPAGMAYDEAGTILRPQDSTAAMFDTDTTETLVVDVEVPAEVSTVEAGAAQSVQEPAASPAAVSVPVAVERQPWRALAAVAHTDGLWLPDGERVDLPDPLQHAGHLAQAGMDLNLGWGEYDEHWQPERGQIWVTPELASQLGLPVELPSERDTRGWKALTRHAWLSGAAADGWQFGQKDDQPLPRLKPWTTLWRPGGGGITVAVTHLTVGMGGQLHQIDPDDHPTPVELAARIAAFAETVGLPYSWAPGVSGVRLMRYLHRDPRHTKITRTIPMPPPILERRTGERELVWHRPPTDVEAGQQWLHGYDVTAMYLAGANSLPVGLDVEAEHVEAEGIPFDHTRPGLWKLTAPVDYPGAGLMPQMVDAVWIDRDGGSWVTTPTLNLIVRDWKREVSISEAYLWPSKARGARIFDDFYEAGRDALYSLPRTGDVETLRRRRAVKALYTAAFGRLAQRLPNGQQGGPWWRPDWQRMIVANSAAKLLRVVAKVGQDTDRWPVAIITDGLYYTSDDPDPITAAPQGISLDPGQVGKFKTVGSVELAVVLEQLRGEKTLAGFADLVSGRRGSEQ